VIHTPQRVKVIHRYHTSQHYAKDYGYGGGYRYKARKPHRTKKTRGRRRRYRKSHHKKIGRRTPFAGGKSYGMYNYARNYRNWAPQRKPQARYRDSYLPITYGQEDDGNNADYVKQESDSTPFANEIQEIDYYAQGNGDYDRHDHSWNQNSRNSHQADNAPVRNRAQGYSTLPDELISSHSSFGGHDFEYSSAAGQDFRVFKNQDPGGSQDFRVFKTQDPGVSQDLRVFKSQDPGIGQDFRVFKTQNPGVSQDFRVFKTQDPGSSQDSRVPIGRNPSGRQEFRLKNHKFGEGEEFRFKNHNPGSSDEKQHYVQNYPDLQGTQINSPNFGGAQTSAGRHDSRYNGQNFRGTHELQYTTQIPHSGQEQRLQIQNFGRGQDLRYNTHNSAGRYRNQNSASGVQSSETTFSTFPGKDNNNPSHRETGHSAGGVENPHANSEDLYYKAFRSFSFRKTPSHSGSKGRETGSSSGTNFSDEGISQSSQSFQSGIEHSDRHNNQRFNTGKQPNKDHDIGFFEGLEEVNDRTGI
jgi:hypothetical protein